MAVITSSITINDFLLQIENIMLYNPSLNWRAPIRADLMGTDKIIVDITETDIFGYGVNHISLNVININNDTTRPHYSIITLKNKLLSILAIHPEYKDLPILLRGINPEVMANINGLNVRDFSILGGTAKGIIVLEAQSE